jgi:hypothetical protein
MRDPGSNPQGVPLWNWNFSCYCCIATLVTPTWFDNWLCHPSVGASLGSAPITCKPADLSPFSGCFTRFRANNVWAGLISHSSSIQFHACCRSSFQLHIRNSRLLGGSPVESLQSRFIHTMSHWSSGLPVCFLSWGTWVQIPRGILKWNRDFSH